MKKLLAMVLCVAMVLSMMAFTVSAENTVSVWDGASYSLEWLEDGKPEANAGDKFYLNSAEDLAGLAYYVNNYASTNHIFEGDTIYLEVDVDLDNCNWDPIGTAVPGEKNRFYGSFDGKGHTISNLKIADGHYYAGLFGQIPTYDYSQTFSNVTINNAKVVAKDETESGDNNEAAGALIGRANGTIIKNCHVTGEINISGDRFVGGLLGHSYAQISNCSVEATGKIKANTWQAGGLVGSHGATAKYTSSVKDCSVIGKGDNGLNITSYFASVGGAIGAVSVSGVNSTPVDGITVANVSIAADSEEFGSGIAYVASGYTATYSTISNVSATLGDEEYVATDAGSVAAAVALVGNSGYATLQAAVDEASEDSTVTVLKDVDMGTTALVVALGKNIVIDLNGKTISGKVGTSTYNDSGVVTNKGTLTIKDSVGNGKIEAVGGNNNAAFWNEVGATATLESGSIISTREGSAWNQSYYTLVNHGTMTINGGTVSTNYEGSALVENGWQFETQNTTQANSVMTINGGSFSGGNYNVKVDGYGVLTVNSGNFDIDRNSNILNWNQTTINGGTFTSTIYNVWTGKGTADSAEYENAYVAELNVADGVFNAGITPFAWASGNHHVSNVTGGIYDKAPSSDFLASDFQASRTATGYEVVKTEKLADTISVIFVEDEAKKTEESKVYNIVLKANGDDKINQLASAELTFALAADSEDDGAMSFTVLPAADFTLTRYDDLDINRYMFNYNGTTAYEGIDNEIVVGTITVDGFGTFTIGTDKTTENAKNVVHATTVSDNLVDSYTIEGLTDTDETTGGLDISGNVSGEIEVAKRTLTINITFPNKVEKNAAAYQDMTVTIVGGNVDEEINLGADGEDGFAIVNDAYTITRDIPYNTTYTVTVSGAGYRTARYSVTLTEDKTLNFWNNVMDNELEVEVGKDSSKTVKTFLAGDIVKDNNINIYDLSAVVSYFGKENVITAASDYAKYDLNRDGVIDSKDVAYVLVSWNN